VNRSTWTREGATHTDWQTADGKFAHIAKGEPLKYFEYKLQAAFLSPLPAPADLDPAKSRLEPESVTLGSVKLPCVMVVPQIGQHGKAETIPMGLFPTYCFDPKVPVLRIMYSFGSVTEEFNHIAKVQGRDIQLFDGKRKILSATLDSVDGMAPMDPMLTPPSDAKVSSVGKVQLAADVVQDALLRRQPPFYPPDAKLARVDGRVVLQAMIGADGGVRDLHVVSAPMASMAASALWAVTHWQYNPFVVKGEPVDVETTINVQFDFRE
jgi:TonB family protein